MQVEPISNDNQGPQSPDAAGGDAENAQAAIDARQAMDRLNQTNRILVGAKMLSRSEKLTDEQIDAVVSRYHEHTKARELSAAQVSRQCGYSKSTLSDWAARKYAGDVDAVTHAVNDWMERDGRRQDSRRPKDYIQTEVAESMRSIIMLADKLTMMATIVVPAGAGKTLVLRAMTEQMNGLYVSCAAGMSVRDFYLAIARALGGRDTKGTSSELRRFIVEKLTGTKRVIFIDEAHQLGARIGYIRSIYDEAKVAVVMAGTDEILKFTDDRAHGRGQFSSRTLRYDAVATARNVEGPDGERGQDLFSIEEIQAFFASKSMRIDRDALRLVWSLSCLPGHGTLRLVDSIVNVIRDLDPDISLIRRADVLEALQIVASADALNLQRLAKLQEKISSPAQAAMAKAG